MMERKEFLKNIVNFATAVGFKPKGNIKVEGEIIADKASRMPNGQIWYSSVAKKNNNIDEYNKKSFIAFILDDEENEDSRYNDLSLVIFPQFSLETNAEGEKEEIITKCLICIGVGTNGFSRDSEIASLPYPRRFFLRLQQYGSKLHFKQNFENIEYTIPSVLEKVEEYGQIEKYGKVLQICEFLDFGEDRNAFKKINLNKNDISLPIPIMRWMTLYAEFRSWQKTENLKKISGKINAINNEELHEKTINSQEDEVLDILKQDRFVVLQGAPGVGKTYTTAKLSKSFGGGTVFTQFHAETTYSDFIYGIEPNTSTSSISYIPKKGTLYKAIETALLALKKKENDNPDWGYLKEPLEGKKEFNTNEAVLLIIDEINRANLSNVLGPVFYLFERSSQKRQNLITIGDKQICRLPENLYVIATMNTADRSLAVVDFALRRRFTWITLIPQELKSENLKNEEYNYFNKDEFDWFKQIFEKYATDAELNLQPGQEYFITKTPLEDCSKENHPMYNMIRYRLMPLIKEYLNEGFMLRAKDEFAMHFFNVWNLNLYE